MLLTVVSFWFIPQTYGGFGFQDLSHYSVKQNFSHCEIARNVQRSNPTYICKKPCHWKGRLLRSFLPRNDALKEIRNISQLAHQHISTFPNCPPYLCNTCPQNYPQHHLSNLAAWKYWPVRWWRDLSLGCTKALFMVFRLNFRNTGNTIQARAFAI